MWRDLEIPKRDGRPMFRGRVEFADDMGRKLAGVVWFDDDRPFYASASMPADRDTIYRIGPCGTLDGAKAFCLEVIEGRKDVSDRAAYARPTSGENNGR